MKANRKNPIPEEHHKHPTVVQFSKYWNTENALTFAMSLIHFGHGQFFRAGLVRHIDILRIIQHDGPHQEQLETILELGLDGVIDATRICLCFEGFMKAKLLMSGYLINELDRGNPKLKDLAKLQRKQAVSIAEVRRVQEWVQEGTLKGIVYMPGVRAQTLPMSLLLSAGYQSTLNLPPKVLAFLDEMNTKRNNLHLYRSDGVEASDVLIDRLDATIKFVREDMSEYHNDMVRSDPSIPEHFLLSPGQRRAYVMKHTKLV